MVLCFTHRQPWNVRAAQENQKPVEPQESGEQNSGPGMTPKPDTSIVNHNTIGCKLVNGRRNGIVHCGRAGNWGDEDMANLAAHIAKKRTVRAKNTYLCVKIHLVPIKYSPHMKTVKFSTHFLFRPTK